MRFAVAASAVVLSSFVASSGLAADRDPARNAPRVDALRKCRAIADIAQRVQCYDRETDSLVAAVETRQIVVIDRSEIRTARRGLFGFSLPRIPFLDQTASKEEAVEVARLTTKIVSIRSVGYGKYRFRIDDGATWETVDASPDVGDLRAGDTITLARGMLGAYFLEARRMRVQARRLPLTGRGG